MDISEIIARAQQNEWLAGKHAQLSGDFDKAGWRSLSISIQEAIDEENASNFANLIVAGLQFGNQEVLNRIRRKGLLRPSKHQFRSQVIVDALHLIIRSHSFPSLPSASREYVTSLSNLHRIGAEVWRMERGLVDLLKVRGNSFLKRLLAAVEMVFVTDLYWQHRRGEGPRRTLDPNSWAREDIAEAFSYLAHLYKSHIGIPSLNWPIDDGNNADEDEMFAFLLIPA